jgi:hypothetical protein
MEVIMKNESYTTDFRNHSASRAIENTYVGYINGKLTRFILRIIPQTKQVVKVEIV